MWASVAKFVGTKTLSAVLIVSGAASLIWFWKHPEAIQAIWAVLKGVLAWGGFVIVLPWATFFVPARVIKLESNPAAAAMLIGYLLADILVALWLSHWGFNGTLAWVVVLLGFLSAAVYNFLVCDFLADKLEESA